MLFFDIYMFMQLLLPAFIKSMQCQYSPCFGTLKTDQCMQSVSTSGVVEQVNSWGSEANM